MQTIVTGYGAMQLRDLRLVKKMPQIMFVSWYFEANNNACCAVCLYDMRQLCSLYNGYHRDVSDIYDVDRKHQYIC